MRPADLSRHTSFRLALTLTLILLAALLLAGGIGYGLMHSQLSSRQAARVTEMFTALEPAMLAGDEADLVEAVTARITASPSRASVFQLKDAAGRVLATNVGGAALPPGWSSVESGRLGIATDYPYRIFSGYAGDYVLSVGLTDADLDDLREIILGAFGWAAVIALAVAIAAGVFLAMRVERRLALVDATLNRVAQGDLAARLLMTGRGDDLDQIAHRINGTLARLAGLVDAMRQVSTDIAHDLRSPLNRLRIRIEDAARKSDAGQTAAEDLAEALAESERIDDTFAALLRIAQIEAGARREKFRPVDIAELLDSLQDIYRDVAEDAGMVLLPFVRPGAPLIVSGDPDLLTRLIANLIENSIRHCPPGATIFCTAEAGSDSATISVADTGPGIPANEREAVMRRLYRLEKSRSTPGSGLGLSLVKAVADLHGAQIVLGDTAAVPPHGLTVRVNFPEA